MIEAEALSPGHCDNLAVIRWDTRDCEHLKFLLHHTVLASGLSCPLLRDTKNPEKVQ